MRRARAVLILALLAPAVPAALAAGAAHRDPVIVAPTDGATVSNPVTVRVDLNGAEGTPATGAMPAMPDMRGMKDSDHDEGHGHAHLIVDAPLPKAGTMVPMDEHHIHVIDDTQATLTLPPGRHTLQLIMAGDDHVVPPRAPRSKKITIRVK